MRVILNYFPGNKFSPPASDQDSVPLPNSSSSPLFQQLAFPSSLQSSLEHTQSDTTSWDTKKIKREESITEISRLTAKKLPQEEKTKTKPQLIHYKDDLYRLARIEDIQEFEKKQAEQRELERQERINSPQEEEPESEDDSITFFPPYLLLDQ